MADQEQKPSFIASLIGILIIGAFVLWTNSCDQSGAALKRQLAATSKAEPAQFVSALVSLSTLATQNSDRLEWDTQIWDSKPKLSPAQKLAELSDKAHPSEGSLEISPALIQSLMDEYKTLPKIVVKPTFWAAVAESTLDELSDDD